MIQVDLHWYWFHRSHSSHHQFESDLARESNLDLTQTHSDFSWFDESLEFPAEYHWLGFNRTSSYKQLRTPRYTPPSFLHSFRMTLLPSIRSSIFGFLPREFFEPKSFRANGIFSWFVMSSTTARTSSCDSLFSQRYRPCAGVLMISPRSRSRYTSSASPLTSWSKQVIVSLRWRWLFNKDLLWILLWAPT